VDNKQQAVAVSNEKEYPRASEDDRQFQLEKPNWSNVNQSFRFEEGNKADMIFIMCHPGHVWDQTNAGGSGPKHMCRKQLKANQRFESRLATEDPSIRSGARPSLIWLDPSPDWRPTILTTQNMSRFQFADVEAKLKFTLWSCAKPPLPEISAKGWRRWAESSAFVSRFSLRRNAGYKSNRWHMYEATMGSEPEFL
jgi:hypothetical protein